MGVQEHYLRTGKVTIAPICPLPAWKCDAMCGLCGYLKWDDATQDSSVIWRMTWMLQHRGPDDQGIRFAVAGTAQRYIVALGHSRLSVIDLSDAAKQPLCNEDGTVWVVFNGEIYNFRELRENLADRGHRFRSSTDTEVVVHGYEEYGCDLLERLDGMFAFALWDEKREELLLARDRTGKKPLFYSLTDSAFTFASEIKAICVCPWVNRQVNVGALPEYFTCGYVRAPRTLYCGIFQLPPASYLVVKGRNVIGPYQYWKLPNVNERGQSKALLKKDDVAAHIRFLVREAVRKRLISDVPLGALLSGGLDSSIIVGLMSQMSSDRIRTFSIGFADDRSFDERSYARLVASEFGTQHTEAIVTLEIEGLLERLVWHHDQPYGDASAVPTYLLCQVARQGVTVALNGDGSDELFGGYERFRAALAAEWIPGSALALGELAAKLLPRQYGYFDLKRRLERFCEVRDCDGLRRYLGWISIFDGQMLANLLGADCQASEVWPQVDSHRGKADLLKDLLMLNFATYLPYDLNVKMDRMSMAHGLETRSPFLDKDLIEYVWQIPSSLKIRWWKPKYILREAFKDLIPRVVLKRPKHGFGIPLGLWFRQGKLRIFYRELVLGCDSRSAKYLNTEVLQSLFNEHNEGREDHGYRLWSLLQFELWLRMLDRDPTWKPPMADLAVDDVLPVIS